MDHLRTFRLLAIGLAVWAGFLTAQIPPATGTMNPKRQLPDAPGSEVTRRVCGTTCHGPDIVMGAGRTRDQWTAVVNAMVSRGAKASETELVEIADYLAKNLGPNMIAPLPTVRGARPGAGPSARPSTGPGPLGSGAADSQIVDLSAAERGKTVYIAECITCHGNKARGANANVRDTQMGSDLVRSLTVLHDRYGNTIGPFLAKGHPLQSGKPSSGLTSAQVRDLSHFLHQKVLETLRNGPYLHVLNVLTGDPKAGAAYFNGAGKCNTCHSPEGDLAGIGRKYDPPTLQSKFLFPRTVGFRRGGPASTTQSKPVMVTITQSTGEVTHGVLDKIDDFNVSLRDAEGEYHSFKRTASLKVEKSDPYAAHVALLDQYTNKNMHDIVAYLETLK